MTVPLTILGVTGTLYDFRLVLQGIVGRKILESSRLVFSEKNSVNNYFALSDAEVNTSGL